MNTPKKNTKKTGDIGEQIAVNYLLKNGFSILHRNFRSGKSEVDIIGQKDDLIIFFEVKTRNKYQDNNPGQLLSNGQQNRIINAAHEYILLEDIELEARFDLIIVLLDSNNSINHIEGAFYATR